MGRNPARKRRREAARAASGRPSTFFIVALVVGLILFFVAFAVMTRRPVPVPAPRKHSAIQSGVSSQLT